MTSRLFEEILSKSDSILKRTLESGASEAELHVVETRRIRIDAAKGIIERITTGTRIDAGVRVVIGKRKGNAGGIISRIEDLYKVIDDALKIAKVSREDPHWQGFATKLEAQRYVEIYDKGLAEAEPKDLVDVVKASIEQIREHKDVRHSSTLLVAANSQTFISNTNGGKVEGSGTSITVSTSASSGTEGSYYDYYISRKLNVDKIIEMSKNVGKRAKESSEAKPVETGTYTVILEPKVVAGVLSSVLEPAFSAENVQQGRSPLKGKLGERIFTEKITIKDDPFIPWNIGSTPFDDEGVATQAKEIISSGVLKTFLYDNYTAKKEGRESTGNGFKRSPWSDPSPRPTNVVIEIESDELDNIIREVKKGVVVGLTIGEWLSNPISGMLNATVTFGYLVEQGEISRTVKGVIISGNIYDALKDKLKGGAGRRECVSSYCTPALVIEGFRLAGK